MHRSAVCERDSSLDPRLLGGSQTEKTFVQVVKPCTLQSAAEALIVLVPALGIAVLSARVDGRDFN